jgi:hypothetical protein
MQYRLVHGWGGLSTHAAAPSSLTCSHATPHHDHASSPLAACVAYPPGPHQQYPPCHTYLPVQAGQLPTTMPRSGTPTDEAGTPQAEITVSESDAGSYQQGKQILATASATSSGGATAAAPTQVPIDGRVATFGTQAGALFRKNAVYQRRNWCSNVCLLSAPIFFCLLLFIIQVLVNRLLLAGEDYEVRGGGQEYACCVCFSGGGGGLPTGRKGAAAAAAAAASEAAAALGAGQYSREHQGSSSRTSGSSSRRLGAVGGQLPAMQHCKRRLAGLLPPEQHAGRGHNSSSSSSNHVGYLSSSAGVPQQLDAGAGCSGGSSTRS